MNRLPRIRPDRPLPPITILVPAILLGSIAAMAVFGIAFFVGGL